MTSSRTIALVAGVLYLVVTTRLMEGAMLLVGGREHAGDRDPAAGRSDRHRRTPLQY